MIDKQIVSREILLALWKVHILHHASREGVVGTWMLHELRHHGYEVSPGTLYPLLRRMEGFGWLECQLEGTGKRARRRYVITDQGREVLVIVRRQIDELRHEVPPMEAG